MLSTSPVVIFSNVAACTSQPVAFIVWMPEHSWISDRRQKQASEKADQSTLGSGVVVIS